MTVDVISIFPSFALSTISFADKISLFISRPFAESSFTEPFVALILSLTVILPFVASATIVVFISISVPAVIEFVLMFVSIPLRITALPAFASSEPLFVNVNVPPSIASLLPILPWAFNVKSPVESTAFSILADLNMSSAESISISCPIIVLLIFTSPLLRVAIETEPLSSPLCVFRLAMFKSCPSLAIWTFAPSAKTEPSAFSFNGFVILVPMLPFSELRTILLLVSIATSVLLSAWVIFPLDETLTSPIAFRVPPRIISEFSTLLATKILPWLAVNVPNDISPVIPPGRGTGALLVICISPLFALISKIWTLPPLLFVIVTFPSPKSIPAIVPLVIDASRSCVMPPFAIISTVFPAEISPCNSTSDADLSSIFPSFTERLPVINDESTNPETSLSLFSTIKSPFWAVAFWIINEPPWLFVIEILPSPVEIDEFVPLIIEPAVWLMPPFALSVICFPADKSCPIFSFDAASNLI